MKSSDINLQMLSRLPLEPNIVKECWKLAKTENRVSLTKISKQFRSSSNQRVAGWLPISTSPVPHGRVQQLLLVRTWSTSHRSRTAFLNVALVEGAAPTPQWTFFELVLNIRIVVDVRKVVVIVSYNNIASDIYLEHFFPKCLGNFVLRAYLEPKHLEQNVYNKICSK